MIAAPLFTALLLVWSAPPAEADWTEARFTDDGVMKVRLKPAKVTLATRFGKLEIPLAEIRQIDFGRRVSDEVRARIGKAIAGLGHADFAEREAAEADLQKIGDAAYEALTEAARSGDPEVAQRANQLLDRLRANTTEEELEAGKQDVVHTADSRIAGRVETTGWQAESAQFGEVTLKAADLRSFKRTAAGEVLDPAKALPDPGSMGAFQNQPGKVFIFRVTGAVGHSVWGTDVYTTDTNLAAAAVHAGALKAGQTGLVKVKILPAQTQFTGSTRNGVTSNNYGQFAGYRIVK